MTSPRKQVFRLSATAVWGGCAIYLAMLPASTQGSKFIRLDGGSFQTGSEKHCSEEKAVRRFHVEPFSIARNEVTNAEFAAFVRQTGYVTSAERSVDPALHPDWPQHLLEPGSMVWEFVADWWVPAHPLIERHDPKGPSETLAVRFAHPAVGPVRVIAAPGCARPPSACAIGRPLASRSSGPRFK